MTPPRTVDRWTLALALLAIDVVLFAVPLTALVAAYVLIARPPWFHRWVNALYEVPGGSGGAGGGSSSIPGDTA